MKYTNKNNLSPLMAGMIEKSMRRYSSEGSKYSTTTLIDPPRLVRLKRLHQGELEEDVGEMIPAFVGNAIHDHLEDLAPADAIVEKRLFATVDDIIISGCLDIMTPIWGPVKQVGDYKTTKVWGLVFGTVYEKWEQQLNINAFLATEDGYTIDDTAFIEYFIMDFQGGRVGTNNYPTEQQGRWETKLWSRDKQLAFIKERIALHEAAEVKLPTCTDKEIWKEDEWKLFKKGNKRAVKKEKTEEDIHQYARSKKIERANGSLITGYSIECMPGIAKRCVRYCSAAPFCEQYQRTIK